MPFTLLHVDTGHNFAETITYRDALVERIGANLVVGSVQEAIDNGMVREETGYNATRNYLQTAVLLDSSKRVSTMPPSEAAAAMKRRARAKERFFSHRDEFGQWDPKNQRPRALEPL